MRVFYSYSHEDESLRNELENHLSSLKLSGVISEWHDRKILAGDNFDRTISNYLNAAEVILFLVSSDFLASGYIRDVEVKRAMERHQSGDARVIPVILRPVDLHGVPFEKLLRLPKDGLPITEWENRDTAFMNVAQGVRAVAQQMSRANVQPSAKGSADVGLSTTTDRVSAASGRALEFLLEPRLLDRGVAEEIPVGEAREVLAMIRRPNSPGLAETIRKEEETTLAHTRKGSYTVREADVRSVPFTVPFAASGGTFGTESLKVKVQLQAPGLEVSESAIAVKIPRSGDTAVLSFLVRSRDTGAQTLKVRVVCDDEEIVSSLLRTKFVRHGGPGPSSPGMSVERDDSGWEVVVLAESELFITVTAKKSMTAAN